MWSKISLLAALSLFAAAIGLSQKQPLPTRTQPAADSLALGEADVKQLLLLMDTNKNGKISKKEYMAYMEAEFDRLDKDKSGELDPHELSRSEFRVSHFSQLGK